MKNIYKIPIANIIHYDEKLDAFSPKTGIKERISSLTTPIQHTTENTPVQQEKGIKGIPHGKEEIKLPLLAMT